MITAVLCTARAEPQFQWMADSLVHNLNRCPIPFELIVVDKLLWAEVRGTRRAQLEEAIQGRFSYRYIPPKPTVWQGPHRKTQRDYYALCNARNTGIAYARGDYIVLFDDCTVLDENWLQWYAKVASRRDKKRACVAGSFRSYTEAVIEDGRVISGTLHPCGEDSRGRELKKCSGTWMYGLNTGFPIEAALAVNGYDEVYDGQGGSEDCSAGLRMELAGFTTVYLPDCLINQILTTHTPVCDFAAWGQTQEKKQKERVLLDGKGHFANEFAIQHLLRHPQVDPLGNDFKLAELRQAALTSGRLPENRIMTPETAQLLPTGIQPPTEWYDWRDGQLLKEMT